MNERTITAGKADPAQFANVKFAAGESGIGQFHAELKRRVTSYLAATGSTGRDDPRLFVKVALILGWFVGSYVLLVFVAKSWAAGALATLSLSLAMAGIGFNVMHDGGHGAGSRRPWVNRAMALSLEVLGGSSYIWRWKHNVVHHTYSNLGGVDDDLEVGPWARLAPHQPRRWFHRYQQFYMWGLFGLLPFKWWLLDIRNYRRGYFGVHRFPAAVGWERAVFVAGKVLLPLWAVGIPLLRHSLVTVLSFYFVSFFMMGVVLSVTFLLAHVVEDAQCQPSGSSGRVDAEWAVHQVETAVDFAPGNHLVSWYLGGLNYQIEHHLFPRISHVLYSAIAPLVRQACNEFGVRYTVRPTLARAIAAHFRWLRLMGRPAELETRHTA